MTTKKFFLILILSTANLLVSAQSKSFLYNEKGQLFLDTTLSISKGQFKTWRHAEFNLVASFSSIKFPLLYLENDLKPKNILIVSFVCDSTDISDIKVLNDTSAYSMSVIKGLKERGKGISAELKESSKVSVEEEYLGRYYIALDFMIIDFYEQMKIQKALPIIKSSIPLVRRGNFDPAK